MQCHSSSYITELLELQEILIILKSNYTYLKLGRQINLAVEHE